MSKALIFVRNPGTQAVALNGTINPGAIVRRFGNKCCNTPIINLNGDGITIADDSNSSGYGYYKVNVDVTVAPTAAGPVTVALLQDGVVVFTKTGTAGAADAATPLSMASPVVRVRGNSASTLTLQLIAGPGNVSEVGVSVEKV